MTEINIPGVLDPEKPRWIDVCQAEKYLETVQENVQAMKEKHYGKDKLKTPEIEDPIHFTDQGNARRFVKLHGDKVRYCHPWSSWVIWNNQKWKIDRTGEILQKAKDVPRSIYEEASRLNDTERRVALSNYAISCESVRKLKNMLEMASTEPGISILPEELDQDVWILPVQNGYIDLKTGELKPHDPEKYYIKIAPVIYDPTAKYPQWLKFLEDVFDGNEELIYYIKKVIGYSLSGSTTEEVINILSGMGANGKSTFLNIVQALLGDFAANTPPETLLIKKPGSINNDIARLRGARFVASEEPDEGCKLAEGLIKQLTGKTITARFLHQEYFEFTPHFKVFLATNHKPIIQGTDHAIWRRIRLIPFNVKFCGSRRDKNLADKLKQELPGILNWAIEGCLEWQKEGLSLPEAVEEATKNYQLDMDVLGEFIDTCCEIDGKASIQHKYIEKAHHLWCGSREEEPLSQVMFSKKLDDRGFSKHRTNKGIFRQGLRLKQDILNIVKKVYDGVAFSVGCKVVKGFSQNREKPSYKGNKPKIPTPPYTPTPTEATDDDFKHEKPTLQSKKTYTNLHLCEICERPLNGDSEKGPLGLGDIHPGCKTLPVKCRVLSDIPEFAGVDNNTFGPFKRGQTASIPAVNFLSLEQRGAVRRAEE